MNPSERTHIFSPAKCWNSVSPSVNKLLSAVRFHPVRIVKKWFFRPAYHTVYSLKLVEEMSTSAGLQCELDPVLCQALRVHKGRILNVLAHTLFSLNFASTKFRDFRDFEKIAKFNTREILDSRKLKLRNLILYNINKIMKFKLLLYYCYYLLLSSPPEDPFSDLEV